MNLFFEPCSIEYKKGYAGLLQPESLALRKISFLIRMKGRIFL